ncbi:MAG: heme-copper oxidase subunit III [Haloferacaceae archaeon]
MSTEEHEEGHHLPAVEDWPRGFGEASWWPFVTALGGAGIYVGAALYILAQGSKPVVGPNVWPVVFVGSIGTFLVGLYGWLYHAFIVHFWSREADAGSAASLRWGMLVFLGSEIATFSAGFVYYAFIRVGTWPPQSLPGLTTSLVLTNTALLVASSFTIHWAHHQLREGHRRNFLTGLGATLLLGIVFLGGQVLEYYEFIVEHGFSLTSGIFGSAFFGLTGLHGLHVTMGAVMLSIVFVRGLRGQFSADRHVAVSTASMYWHFVDIVWIFLVAVLYVGAEIGA